MLLVSFLLGIFYVESLYMLSRYTRWLYLSSLVRLVFMGIFFSYILKSFGQVELLLNLLVFHLGFFLHLIVRGWIFNGLVKNY